MSSTRKTVVAYSSAARTASPTDAVIDVPPATMSVLVIIDATAIAATPSVVFNIRGVTPVSGTQFLILASAAVTAVSNTQLELGPGADDTANVAETTFLPPQIVIDPVHGDADSITYSVVCVFI